MESVDFLIVGQGLAGTILATEIKSRGQTFKIVDSGYQKGSTYVAAGVINPLVLKRLTKSWRAKEFIKYNEDFYKRLNQFYGKKIHIKNKLFKLINSDDEQLFWSKRFKEEDVSFFINEQLDSSISHENKWSTSFHKGEVQHTSWVNLKLLLHQYRTVHQDHIIEDQFDFNDLQVTEQIVTYKTIKAKSIVFCDGAKIKDNPFFSYIPMGFNKGELITIESKDLDIKDMFKKKVFILPFEKNIYKVGATFEWKWESNSPSEKKKKELIEDLNQLINVPYRVIKHEAGIRPSVKDRRPLLGAHPTQKNTYIFNGLGSRGCLMAPLLSKELIDFIEYGKALHQESDIQRFQKYLGQV